VKSQNEFVINKTEHPKDFYKLEQITKHFKIKNLKHKGDTMLLDLTSTSASTGPSSTLPDGDYLAYIDTAELKPTKDGSGQYIRTMWKVASGQHQNRTVFHNYNIKNKSEKAQEIGLSDLKKLLEVNGRTNFQIKAVGELVGLKALVHIKTKSQAGYADQNTISSYKPATQATTTATTQKGKPSSSPVPGF